MTNAAERIDQNRKELTTDDTWRLDAVLDAAKAELKSDIRDLKIMLHEMAAGIHAMKAKMARMEFLVEEQNARNTVVLDAYNATLDRHDEIEERLTKAEEMMRKLSSAGKR